MIFVGTPAVPNASGEAKKGATAIEVKVKGVPQSTTSGSEFLTFGSGSSHQIVLTRAKLRSIRMEKRSGQVSPSFESARIQSIEDLCERHDFSTKNQGAI